MKLQKKVLKNHQILMGSGEKVTTKRNYWSKDSQRNSENIYENTPQISIDWKIKILQVWLFLVFVSSNRNDVNPSKVLAKSFCILFLIPREILLKIHFFQWQKATVQ